MESKTKYNNLTPCDCSIESLFANISNQTRQFLSFCSIDWQESINLVIKIWEVTKVRYGTIDIILKENKFKLYIY